MRILQVSSATNGWACSRGGQLRSSQKYIARFEGREEGSPEEAGEPVHVSERDKHRKPLRVHTMSQEEWEAVSIYQVFAFKKKSQ